MELDNDVCVIAGQMYPNTFLEEAILSLYWDQIRPSDLDIIRRIAEIRKDPIQRTAPEPDSAFVCDPIKYLVSKDSSGRYVVEFREPPSWFLGWVDPADPESPFPVGVREGLVHCILCLSLRRRSSEDPGEPYQFKGGRYGLARRLQELVLDLYDPSCPVPCESCRDFFESIQFLSLGRLCQLVQWGINMGIVRYEDNLLQPAASCKVPSAALASKLFPSLPIGPCITKNTVTAPISQEIQSLQELEEYLERLCRDSHASELPLSQVKKRLISEYAIVLNPSRLGFVKISDVVRELEYFELFTVGQNNAYLRLMKNCSATPSTCTSAE